MILSGIKYVSIQYVKNKEHVSEQYQNSVSFRIIEYFIDLSGRIYWGESGDDDLLSHSYSIECIQLLVE